MKIFLPVCDDDLINMKHIRPDMLVPYHQDYTSVHRLDGQHPRYTNDNKKLRRQA
jgi:hypothetical protein